MDSSSMKRTMKEHTHVHTHVLGCVYVYMCVHRQLYSENRMEDNVSKY